MLTNLACPISRLIMIMIFYCGLMVHITDTRAQNVFCCTSAHITETVLAHDQHWEEQSSLSSPQLYRHSQKHRKWITIQYGITQPMLVRVQPWDEQGLSQHFLLFYAWCVHSVHILYYTKATLVRRKLRNNSRTTTAFVLHTGVLNNWGKMKFVKSIRHFKRLNKIVGWRCASYKKSIQVVS